MALISSVVAVLLLVGFSVGQDFADDLDQQWPAGISPLDSLSYWDEQETPIPVEDKAKGCCLPKQFTTRAFVEVRQGGRRPRTVRSMEVAYVDQDGQRIRSDVTVTRRGRPTTISSITLYNRTANSSTLYTFSNQTKRCMKKDRSRVKFPSFCLPDNSTLRGSFYLGAGPRTLNTQTWSYVARTRKATVYTNSILVPDNCVPVLTGQKIIRRTNDNNDDDDNRIQVINVGTIYTNSTTNITDPSVFTPPSICNKMDDEALIFGDGDIDLASSIANRYL